jgi:hypothetical protein
VLRWCPHCLEYSYVNAKIGAIKICQFCGRAILPEKRRNKYGKKPKIRNRKKGNKMFNIKYLKIMGMILKIIATRKRNTN